MTAERLEFASASTLLKLLRERAITSSQLLDLYLSRIEQHNPTYNLVVTFDIDRARREAALADERRARGESNGPLDGLPITIKESFEAVGMPASCGFPHLRDHFPDSDADSVLKFEWHDEHGALLHRTVKE